MCIIYENKRKCISKGKVNVKDDRYVWWWWWEEASPDGGGDRQGEVW